MIIRQYFYLILIKTFLFYIFIWKNILNLINILNRLLSTNGLLYSFGKSNSSGQLGHGDKNSRNLPTLIEKLKNLGEMIKFVSCGFKHVICKTGLSKIYCWGDNTCGQLGTGTFQNEVSPKVINLERLDSFKIK